MRTAWAVIGLLLAIFSATWLGSLIIAHAGHVLTIWAPGAILLAGLLLLPPAIQSWLTAGGAAAGIVGFIAAGTSWPATVPVPVCDAVGALAAAIAIRAHLGSDAAYARTRAQLILALFAGLLKPTVSTLLLSVLVPYAEPSAFAGAEAWFLGDAVGTLVIVPIAVGLSSDRPHASSRRWSMLSVMIPVGATLAAFIQTRVPIASLVFPALVTVAFLADYLTTSLAVLAVTVLASTLTAYGFGPFTRIDPFSAADRAFYLQIYLAAVALVATPAAAALESRRRLEAALRRAEAQLTMMLRRTESQMLEAIESMADGLAVYDADERLMFCNRRYRETHPEVGELLVPGADFTTILQEAVSRHQFRDLEPEDEAAVAALVAAKRAGGDFEIEQADGRWYEASTRRTCEGGLINVRRDVTRFKQAERRSRENEERYRLLVETSPDAVLVHQDAMIILANEQARVLLGAAATADLLGRPIFSLVHHTSVETARARTARLRAPGDRLEPAEITYCRLDGTPIPVEAAAASVIVNGRVAVQIVIRDISERRKLLQELAERTSRLEQMNAELDQFASMAAHDLRAPLRQVGIVCQMLATELGDNTDDHVRARLDQVGQRVRRMDSLVEGLRQYAHAGGQAQAVETVVLESLAQEAVEFATPPPTLVIEIAPQLPRLVAPTAAIALILRNLIGNAVRHHDRADGRIRISAHEARDEVIITIEDDGPGMPTERRAYVFDLFARFRGDAAEPDGIGLALVRRTVSAHGGRVAIGPSSFGRGTAVTVTWPKRGQVAA